MDLNSTIRMFNNWADSYDTDVAEGGWGFEFYSDAIEWICSQITSKHHTDRIIDLGCGTGIVAKQLLKYNPYIEYIGIDISERMLEVAKDKCPKSFFIRADMRQHLSWVNYLEPSLHCTVISTYALHHINDSEKIELIKYLFETSKRMDLRLVIVDYAFFDMCERKRVLHEQTKKGNFNIVNEIKSEHYANLSFIANILSQNNINFTLQKNGFWDWRILCEAMER